jgi:glycerate 2-kinase
MERSLERLRADVLAIFNAAVKTVDAAAAVRRHVRVSDTGLEIADTTYLFTSFPNIYIFGAGKAAVPMAQAMETLLGERLSTGIVVTKYGQALPVRKARVLEAAHPIPDFAGLEGARQIAAMARQATEDDLIFCLLSGGGSALLPYPIGDLSLADKQYTTELLLRSGATIREINTVRRHLSQLKGGKLAQLAYPAQIVSLIISDVIGDTLEDIASGPAAPDPTRYSHCLKIIRKYRLEDSIPAAVRQILHRGARGELPAETVTAHDVAFTKVHNVIIASNRLALEGARSHAEGLGYRSSILSDRIEGESRNVAQRLTARLRSALNEPEPVCFISGGETTVTVRGDGMGGRNQEFALAAAIEIAGIEGMVVLSAGTDGIDGPTNAAGAIVDGATIFRGQLQGCDATQFLARNDAYNFLRVTDDLLITGPTNTNVMDIHVMMAG